jgi:hypothetical protein
MIGIDARDPRHSLSILISRTQRDRISFGAIGDDNSVLVETTDLGSTRGIVQQLSFQR